MFARLRNIRNMLEAGISGEEIFDEDDLQYVGDSKIYPFRFYQAYKVLKHTPNIKSQHLEDWLSKAIDSSANNIPDELGNTFVAVDLSGSMTGTLSRNSVINRKDISSLLGAILMRKGASTGVFGSGFEMVNAHYKTPTLELARKIRSKDVGHSTNGWKAIKHIIINSEKYERVIVLTDMQIWDSSAFGNRQGIRENWNKYTSEINPEASLYMMDLASYGDLVTPESYENVYNISGWNDKIFDYIESVEHKDEILNKIENM
jgi:hypothetical protein